MFCTEEQVSVRQFHQFCNLTKISIEIRTTFVYNVFIVVLGTKMQAEEGNTPSRKEK